MKCERCNEKQATIIAKAAVNGKITRLFLCEECLKELRYSTTENFSEKSAFEIYLNAIIDEMPGSRKKLICPSCKTDYYYLKKHFSVGCPYCYITFSKLLKNLFIKKMKNVYKKNENLHPIEKLFAMDLKEKLENLRLKLKIYSNFEDISLIRKTLKEIKELKKDDNAIQGQNL
ncbi:MAG: hypothetical protein K6357_07805 [Elusimicrobiota bacterium]